MKKILLLIVGLNLIVVTSFGQRYERYKKLTDTTLLSTNLEYQKQITVMVPIEWQDNSNHKFPLIVVFDRQREYNHAYILKTIDYLTNNGQMPASIILSVESEQEHRYWETLHKASGNESKAIKNEQFLFEELFPLAEHKFKAAPFRTLIGHSRHGYYTTALFHSRINDLNAVISLSPFFYEKNINLVDSIASLNKAILKTKKYYRYAIGNDYPEHFNEMVLVESEMTNQNIDIKGRLFKYADHYATPGLVIAQSLYEIFEFWSIEQFEYLYSTDSIKNADITFKNKMLEHYGNHLECSFETINSKGWNFFNDKDYVNAINVWRKLLEKYPNFSEAYLYIIEAEKMIGGINVQTLKAFKENLSASKFYSDFKKMDLLNDLDELVDN